MKFTIRRDCGGYGLEALASTPIDGLAVEKPFALLTGPNGSGKSAVLRGIRASLGLRGERGGSFVQREFGKVDEPPALFDLTDLGWRGQHTYLFDSRAASAIAGKASFDDDMLYHASLIVGGGKNVSHGQFIKKTWWEALSWAIGDDGNVEHASRRGRPMPDFQAAMDAALGDAEPSTERWMLVDEPETAIDAEILLVGLCVLLEHAEIGRLRVFCASHSLLFAAGLMRHDKIQIVDMGGSAPWLQTQELALRLANDHEKVGEIGRDLAARLRRNAPKSGSSGSDARKRSGRKR